MKETPPLRWASRQLRRSLPSWCYLLFFLCAGAACQGTPAHNPPSPERGGSASSAPNHDGDARTKGRDDDPHDDDNDVKDAPARAPGLAPLGGSRPGKGLIGAVAPPLTARDREGRPIDLESFRGRVVVLNFWATWCPPCLEELPSFERLKNQLEGSPVDIVGISVDEGWEEIDKVLEKHPVTFLLGLNSDREDPARYGTVKFPETFIIDKQGKVVRKFVGAQIWDRGDQVARLIELAED